jgi:hypothetical protein
MELKDILPIAIALAAFVLGIIQFLKNQQLQRRNQELQEQMHAYQKEQDAKKELDKAADTFNEEQEIKRESRTDKELYCDDIAGKFQYLDFTGLKAILMKPLRLEDVYVKLRAKRARLHKRYETIADFRKLAKENTNGKDGEEKDEEFTALLTRLRNTADTQREPMKLVLLGQPGSGKTTLMKWLALQCACHNAGASTEGLNHKNSILRDIPVYIPLKDLGADPAETFKKFNILELTLQRLNHQTLGTSFIKEAFEADRLLFLLDGLDEVAEEAVRRSVIQWIQNQNIRRNSLVVTSRFSGLQEARGMTFHDAVPVYSLLDFDIADIEGFLERWYRNIETAVAGAGDSSDQQDEKERAVETGMHRYEDLMRIIKDDAYTKLRELAVNPLLLTIIAIVHRTRAHLPKERHKLYDECLKVMIELWNVANKGLDVSFPVDTCLHHLSRLAVYLMEHNRREIERHEITELLPAEVEGKDLDFFLGQMVLRAGLLFESEGKYGFLHLTIQEYLAAWYFTRQDNPNDILEYRDKDYWTETFKLFVNTGNPRPFFNEIIENLEEKEYWRQMNLWEACLQDLVVRENQKEIELKFARHILKILPRIEYKVENEELILQLYPHYSLYTHASEFHDEGLDLFHNARHPFVQSVGSSILNKAGEESQARLMEALKTRINRFEGIPDKTDRQMLDFLYQNDNSFVLLIAGRKNLLDFNVALATLKSSDFFLIYIDLLDLLDLRYLQDLRDLLDLRDLRYLRDLRDLLDLRYLRDLLDLLDLRDLRDLRDLLDLRYLRYLRDLRYLLDFRDLRYLRDLLKQFLKKYHAVIEKHKADIDAWTDNAIKKLHKMSDKELLKYFPGTSPEDFKAFRDEQGSRDSEE